MGDRLSDFRFLIYTLIYCTFGLQSFSLCVKSPLSLVEVLIDTSISVSKQALIVDASIDS
jgi:hypothetical protein